MQRARAASHAPPASRRGAAIAVGGAKQQRIGALAVAADRMRWPGRPDRGAGEQQQRLGVPVQPICGAATRRADARIEPERFGDIGGARVG
jgi:hypothetical protein